MGLGPWSGGERSEPERKGPRRLAAGGFGCCLIQDDPTHDGLFPKLTASAWFFLYGGVGVPAGSDSDGDTDLLEAVAH